ncbi:MAG: Vitamin B12 dependent methionine synthase activation subunit [Clostridiales bacterium]|nr:Vitamin B12 dependent methionine synthase activation subunit [Clostridiales bacterium]
MDRKALIGEALASDKQTIPQYLDYETPSLNVTEWLRYSCIPVYEQENAAKDPELASSMEKALSLINGALSFRVGFVVVPLTWDEEGFPVFPFEQRSEKLRKNLQGCDRAVLFAATIGSGIDRLIRRYEKADPKLGLLLQGLGAERVESLCDAFNDEVKEICEEIGRATRMRYSPGYGDLPIEVQKVFLPLLDAERRLGITLSESCLMAPSKSVTAIIGIAAK